MMKPSGKPTAFYGKRASSRVAYEIAFARRSVRAFVSAAVALCLCCFTPFAALAESTDADTAYPAAEDTEAPQASQNDAVSPEQIDSADGIEAVGADNDGAEAVRTDLLSIFASRTAETISVSFDFTGIDASRGNGFIDIDGVPYLLNKEESTGEYTIELPAPADGQATVCFATFCIYNNPGNNAFADTSYPIGMYAWELSYENDAYTAKRLAALDNALKYAGCSVRAIGKTGIRIVTEVPKSLRSSLINGGNSSYTLLEYGTAVQWDSTLQTDNKSLTLGTTSLSSYAYNKQNGVDQIYKNSGTSIKYTGVLVGFSDEAIKHNLSIRPYMKLVDSAGHEHVLYGGVVHRSIGYIASQNYNAFGKGTVGYNYIWRMIHLKYGNELDTNLNYQNWDIRAHVPELFQMPELPWGCESVSLVIALRAMGYSVGKTEIYDSYLSHSSWDYVYAFAGDAYNKTGIGETYPPAIVDAANRYLKTHGAAERAVNLSGASFNTLLGYIDNGYPVLVWTTMYMGAPRPMGMSLYGYVPYGNEHCVVMYGHSGGSIQVSDPLSGKVTRSYDAFASLYERCGCYAVVII